ncbi:MAG: hypothetical protein ACMUHU_03825 [Thermoplasmatota archaeon]
MNIILYEIFLGTALIIGFTSFIVFIYWVAEVHRNYRVKRDEEFQQFSTNMKINNQLPKTVVKFGTIDIPGENEVDDMTRHKMEYCSFKLKNLVFNSKLFEQGIKHTNEKIKKISPERNEKEDIYSIAAASYAKQKERWLRKQMPAYRGIRRNIRGDAYKMIHYFNKNDIDVRWYEEFFKYDRKRKKYNFLIRHGVSRPENLLLYSSIATSYILILLMMVQVIDMYHFVFILMILGAIGIVVSIIVRAYFLIVNNI